MTYPISELPLNERIRAVRKQVGPTQKAFADKLGTSPNRVNAWENGRSRPGEDYAAKIAALGGYPVELFMPAVEAEQDVRAELAEIRAALEAMSSRRESFRVELARQLKRQTDLLATLTAASVELRQLVVDLREAHEATRRPSRRQRPA